MYFSGEGNTLMEGVPAGMDTNPIAGQFFSSSTGGVMENCAILSQGKKIQLAYSQPGEVTAQQLTSITLADCYTQQLHTNTIEAAAMSNTQAVQMMPEHVWSPQLENNPFLSAVAGEMPNTSDWSHTSVHGQPYHLTDNEYLPTDLLDLELDPLSPTDVDQ